MKNEIVELLKTASGNLQFPSESEYPFETFAWNDIGDGLDSAKILEILGLPSDTHVEVVDLDHFFRNVTTAKEWQDDDEKREVEAFQKLVKTLKQNLGAVKVYRVGAVEVGVYIVGESAPGEWGGLKTTVVET